MAPVATCQDLVVSPSAVDAEKTWQPQAEQKYAVDVGVLGYATKPSKELRDGGETGR
jgi:hypothetical protein